MGKRLSKEKSGIIPQERSGYSTQNIEYPIGLGSANSRIVRPKTTNHITQSSYVWGRNRVSEFPTFEYIPEPDPEIETIYEPVIITVSSSESESSLESETDSDSDYEENWRDGYKIAQEENGEDDVK